MAGNAGINADIQIEKLDQWKQFRANNLDTIVDPMVFRAADIFLRGRTNARETLPIGDAEKIWQALSTDLNSVQAFFDQLLLNDRLPLIDYGITFDSALNYDTPWVCQTVNEALEFQVVYTVHVSGEASQSARDAATAAMNKRPEPSPELRKSVTNQLNALDFAWRPDLDAFQQQFPNLTEDDLKLARFLYGGLIFSAFCQMSGSSHVLQGNRGRLSTSLAIDMPFSTKDKEGKLLAELNRRIRKQPEYKKIHIESLSSFLPLLLAADPKSPLELLRSAKKYRSKKIVTDYRNWRRDLLRNWVDKGQIKEADEKKIMRVAEKIRSRFNLDKRFDLEVGIDPEMKVSAKTSVPAGRIWGWTLENLGGQRYLKVLANMAAAGREYPQGLKTNLKTLWDAADPHG
jgi:hypothetical protein